MKKNEETINDRQQAFIDHYLATWNATQAAKMLRAMTFDLKRILESKRAYRQALAVRPIAEKLRMLDALRERALALRTADPTRSGIVRESSAPYRRK